jgi:xylulokinase
MSYYLTFDLGTTALKTALVTDDGRLAGVSVREYTPRQPKPGFMEMDPQVYWQAAVEGTHQVLAGVAGLADSRAHPPEVKAIGFSSQGQTFVPLDRSGKPLYDAIVWLDNRAQSIAERWQAAWLSPDSFHRTSGYPWIPAGLTVFKIAWLRENIPTLPPNVAKYLWLPDYLIYRLTGETVTDTVTARMGGLFNYRTGDWEPALLAASGVTPEQLPTVLPPGSIAGRLSRQAASELGLPAGIPVCTGANDQLVGGIGAGNVQPGMVTETTGTALAVVTTTTAPLDDLRVTVGSHALPGLYYAMAFANTSAVLLTWLRELCDKCSQDYDTFLQDTASVPPGCEGLCVLPHFMGAIPPYGDPAARGAFIGLTLSHRRAHLARAIMEACACLLRECLEPVHDQKVEIHQVRSLGGAARNDLWLQMKADMLGLPVERPAMAETASLGAAMLAATALGQFANLSEAAAAWYRPSAVFTPNATLSQVYQQVYNRYQRYSRLLYGSFANNL